MRERKDGPRNICRKKNIGERNEEEGVCMQDLLM